MIPIASIQQFQAQRIFLYLGKIAVYLNIFMSNVDHHSSPNQLFDDPASLGCSLKLLPSSLSSCASTTSL